MAEVKLDKNLSKKERLITIVNRLKPNVDLMERFVGLIKKYQMLLSEPRLLFRHRKDSIAFLMAIELYNRYKSNQPGPEQIENYIKKIKVYDEGLAKDIKKTLPVLKSEQNIFSDLFQAYAKGKEYFIAYISTFARELITKAKSIENKAYSRRLVELFSIISGHEVKYLIKYRNDCANWTNIRYTVNFDMGYFMRMMNLYLKGGFEENVQFIGLYKDFGDRQLAESMLENAAVKRIWKHNEQINYLRVLIGECIKAQTSGEWLGFYGKEESMINGVKVKPFWPNFNEHAETFNTKYGNSDFEKELVDKKKLIGESPEVWGGVWKASDMQDLNTLNSNGVFYIVLGSVVYTPVKDGELPKLLRTLQDSAYQRTKIIMPASAELQKILKNREDELIRARDKSIADLIESLHKLYGVDIDRDKILKNFRKLLEKKKLDIAKISQKELNELITKAADALFNYEIFSKQYNIAMAKADLDFRVNRMQRLALLSISNSKYIIIKQKTDEFLRNLGELVRLDGASGTIAEASFEITELMEFNHLNENDFKEMEKLIPQASNVIRKLRNFIINYLKKEIEKKFTITIDEVENLPINIVQSQQKNIDMQEAA